MTEQEKCATCESHHVAEKIKVDDMNFDPPAVYRFCTIFCRNVFLNANKGLIKPSRDYGNTLARIGSK